MTIPTFPYSITNNRFELKFTDASVDLMLIDNISFSYSKGEKFISFTITENENGNGMKLLNYLSGSDNVAARLSIYDFKGNVVFHLPMRVGLLDYGFNLDYNSANNLTLGIVNSSGNTLKYNVNMEVF